MIPVKSFRERRRHLASLMHKGVAIVPTAAERVRNRDAHYPYSFDS
jgi:Xaa-Pro aminopeptidase